MTKSPDLRSSHASTRSTIARSPLLLDRRNCALLVVDLQARLVPVIGHHENVVWNVGRLVRGAHLLSLPVVGTEQYPEKLGRTVPPIAEMLSDIAEKRDFSCGACPALFRALADKGCSTLLVAGVETHVCVMQTVLDLLADGFDVFVPVDAVGARHELDHRTALHRMDVAGATLTTTESALFEWCETSMAPEFKQISALVRETVAPRD
jgi:nicotinamidase-related amidase